MKGAQSEVGAEEDVCHFVIPSVGAHFAVELNEEPVRLLDTNSSKKRGDNARALYEPKLGPRSKIGRTDEKTSRDAVNLLSERLHCRRHVVGTDKDDRKQERDRRLLGSVRTTSVYLY